MADPEKFVRFVAAKNVPCNLQISADHRLILHEKWNKYR